MDMLGNTKIRKIITESYYLSSEPMLVRKAITDARYIHIFAKSFR